MGSSEASKQHTSSESSLDPKLCSPCRNCLVSLPQFIAEHPGADRRQLLRHVAEDLHRHHHVDRVVHGDVRMRNVVVSACGVARLIKSTKTIPTTEQPRAPTYPEDRLPMTTATDVYAFGWLVFQVMTDIDPFEMVRNPNIMKLIASGVKPNRPGPSTLPWKRGLDDDVLSNQCLRCWEISPTQRPTMEDVLEVFNLSVAPACPCVGLEQLSGSETLNSVAIQRVDAAQDNAAGGRRLCITINAETSLTILGRSSYSLVQWAAN